MSARPYIWEKSYPPGISWDTPIVTTTLPELIERSAARFPDKPAIEFRDRRLLYKDLVAASQRMTAGLLRHGIGRDTAVGLYLPNTPDHPIALFGVTRTGARVVQLSPLDAERELIHKTKDSGARVVLTINLPGLLPMAQKLKAAGHIDLLIVADDSNWGSGPVRPLPIGGDGCVSLATLMQGDLPTRWPQISKDDIAVLQYTGGTTGIPKGAMLTHANLTASCAIYDSWFNPQSSIKAGDARVICALPLFHTFGQTCGMNATLGGGGTLTLIPRFDPAKALEIIQRDQVNVFQGVPTMYGAMLHLDGREDYDVSTLKVCASGGSAMPVELMRGFEEAFGCKVLEGYGLSESSPVASFNHPDRERKPGSIGTPIEGVEMKIVDDDGNEVDQGDVGEIVIKGHNVMNGYWKRDEATAETIVDGWLHTGDIGKVDEDGYFFIVDRKKEMIIRGGYNVYPREIEEVLYEHPDVREAAVLGIPSDEYGEEVAAAVALKDGASTSPEELRSYVKEQVAGYKYPRKVWLVDELPKGPTGKILKREIKPPADDD